MNERVEVVMQDGAAETWTLGASEDPPWTVTLTTESGVTYTGEGDDLFQALQEVRRPLDDQMIRLCCNGARRNAHTSGATSRQGGFMVYLNHRWRPATIRDLVYVFGPAQPEDVATVEEQEHFWRDFIERRSPAWLVVLNPVRWFYYATRSWQGFGRRGRMPMG
ncbi:hypothetical protein ACGF0D_24675 [Kitasatospora sp. NPDC048298]|uniref:hypothetical protein n=1 Tax=Kitasatospora sp. NPDC048298 TaxID=3364049 RepID=UPI003711F4D6